MIKKVYLLITLTSTLLYGSYNYNLEPKKVSDNVWCFFGLLEGPKKENAGNMVNTCYIKTRSNYIVIDSGPSYVYAKEAYNKMSKIANLPVKAVILSHDHDDHWLGNSFYKEKFNSELIGVSTINKNYKAGDKTRMFRVLPKEAIKNTNIIKLDTVINKTQKRVMDGVEIEIVYVGTKSHTQEDIFVYMPKQKVLFAGDLVMNGRITSNRHGSLIGQIKALKMIKQRDWDILVPGHGFNFKKDALNESWEYFTTLKKAIQKAIEDGVDLSDINSVVKMKDFQDKAMFDLLNGQNVSEAYQEMEFLD
jgi:glyoxylase-like metal-dependent hydrolase (beta-lactamase superfamily II)